MDKLLQSAPVVFIMLLLVAWLLSRVLSVLAFRVGKKPGGEGKAYACGEDNYDNSAQPDYSTFFAFAFFFTLAHVATLVMTTVPTLVAGVSAVIFVYILAVAAGLYVLLRRQQE
ncbi:MAG: hypothetical protein PHJ00_01165 [Candidatus Omnitrophica bacterium]|nr:hypothetical protein [Candidatus Omnitrophota bacterium]MDD5655049.1 hypothetical protein [Candidatus Omnitrophota bacterium]